MSKKAGLKFSFLVGGITLLDIEFEVTAILVFMLALDTLCNINVERCKSIIWGNRLARLFKLLIIISLTMFSVPIGMTMMILLAFYITYKYVCKYDSGCNKKKGFGGKSLSYR